MQLTLVDDLPFVTLTLTHQGATLAITNVLIDTGSATAILAADQVTLIGLVPAPDDILYTIRVQVGWLLSFSFQGCRLYCD